MFGLGMPELIVSWSLLSLYLVQGDFRDWGRNRESIKSFKKAINEPEEIDVTPPPAKDEKKKKEELK